MNQDGSVFPGSEKTLIHFCSHVADRFITRLFHRGQTSEHAREIARDRIVSVTRAASSCELEPKFSFYFNEVHRR